MSIVNHYPVGVIGAFTWAQSKKWGKPRPNGLRHTDMAVLAFADLYEKSGKELLAAGLYELLKYSYNMNEACSKKIVWKLVKQGYMSSSGKQAHTHKQVLSLAPSGRVAVYRIEEGLRERESFLLDRLDRTAEAVELLVRREIKELPAELRTGWIGELPI